MDTELVRALNAFAQHEPARAIALLAAKYLVVAPAAIVLALGVVSVRRRDDRALGYLGLAIVGTAVALGLNQVVGHVYFRLRPYWAIASVHAVGSRGGDSSFYSDHTAVVAGLTFGVFVVSLRWGWVSLACALLVALGRVAIGAHYPSDVLIAAVVAIALVAALVPFRHPAERSLNRLLGHAAAPKQPRANERRLRAGAVIVLAVFVGWMAGRIQDHGLHTALSRAEGRIHGDIPSDARLYRSTTIATLASGQWRSSRARVYGVVTYVTREPDGDVHVILKAPDRSFIVLEITPEIPLPAPHDDDRITAWGVVRHDGLHNWWELHPLTGWSFGRSTVPSAPGLDD